MSPREHTDGLEVWDYLAVVRRNLALVVGVTAVVVVSALALTSVQQPVFTSNGRLHVAPRASLLNTGDTPANSDFVQTEIQFLESEGVRSLVREQLGSAPKVDAVQIGTTSVVEVSAEGRTAERARATADAYMAAYLTFRHEAAMEALGNTRRQVQATIDDLQRQIDALSAQLRTVVCPATGGCPERTALEQDRDARVQEQVPFRQRLSDLNIESSSVFVGAVVVPADLPASQSSPNPVLNGAAALVLGSVLGVGLAIVFERRDDSVRDGSDVERATPNSAVLGVIPPSDGADLPSKPQVVTVSEPTSPSAEAYRSLRTSIRFLGVDRELRSIQVTSATDSEGKTTTTANLGVVLARAGELVIMVDCDLRRPRLHEYFGMANETGLTSVLLGEATLGDALRCVTEDRRLWLLSAGPRPPNPSDLLSSARASEVLDKLQKQASVVVIDCPPVLTVSDAAIVSGKVDGTLLVARATVSSRKKLTRAVDFLNQIGAPLLGIVLHTTSNDRAGQDGYWPSGSHAASPRRGTQQHEASFDGARQRRFTESRAGGEVPMAASSSWAEPGDGSARAGGPLTGQPAPRRRKNRRP